MVFEKTGHLVWIFFMAITLNLFFAFSLKASTSNISMTFVGSLVFSLRFKKNSQPQIFFWFSRKSRQRHQMTNMNRFDTLTDLVFSANQKNCWWSKLKILVLFRKTPAFPQWNLCCKPPVLYELQTEKKQLRLVLQNSLVNSLMFVYQDITEL